jgi:hypothetical protein
MPPEIQLPPPGSRLRVLAGGVLVVIVVAAVSLWLRDTLTSAQAQGPCEQAAVARDIVLGLCATLFVALWWLASGAARIFWHGRFPPPRARVLRPTRVRRGAAAMLIGAVHVLFALAIALVLVLYGGDVLSVLLQPLAGCRS